MTTTVVIFILLSVLGSAAYKLLIRRVLRPIEPYAFSLIQNLIAAVIFLPAALAVLPRVTLPSSSTAWLALIVAVALWTIATIVSSVSYKRTEVSLRGPISQSRLIWVMLLGLVVLGESASWHKIIGGLIIFIGVSLLIWHPERRLGRLSDPAIKWTLWAALISALAAIADKYTLKFFPTEVYGFLVYLLPAMVMLGLIGHGEKAAAVRQVLRRDNLPGTIVISLIGAATYYCSLRAYQLADISLAYPLLQLDMLIVVLAGILFMGEREHFRQKIIAAVVVIAGSIVLKL